MDATTFSVTERAAQRIAKILKAEAPASVLRVSVEGGGCSGFQYRFVIEGGGTAEDLVIEREGATVVIDPVSLQYLAGSKLDFTDDLIGAAFQVVNPNATASCGCGTSFAL
jgi:iron-sulfur cluster assembly accessory protein